MTEDVPEFVKAIDVIIQRHFPEGYTEVAHWNGNGQLKDLTVFVEHAYFAKVGSLSEELHSKFGDFELNFLTLMGDADNDQTSDL